MVQISVHGSQPQSAGQFVQSSQAGSQNPSPHVGWQAPMTQSCVHGVQPQSAWQLLQFSHAGSQVPSPQVG